MDQVRLSLLRGVCQMPAYVALELGIFRKQKIEVQLTISATAWLVPERLQRGQDHFAVIPWTRVAAAVEQGEPLVAICGSGCEEAAIVVRSGIKADQVRSVALPQRGGIKDLTAIGLLNSLGWTDIRQIRMPSGDGAILAFVGRGADAVSLVEPYAAMLEGLGSGTVVKRTGDLWQGAPGCSLTTTDALIRGNPGLVQRMVQAFVEGARFVETNPADAAVMAAKYIGIDAGFIRQSLGCCRPNPHALRNEQAIQQVLTYMIKLGYLKRMPDCRWHDPQFLDAIAPRLDAVPDVCFRAVPVAAME